MKCIRAPSACSVQCSTERLIVFGKSIPPSGKQLLRTKQLDLTKQQDKHLLTFVLTQIFSVLMVVGPSSGVNEQWEIVPTHAFTGVH